MPYPQPATSRLVTLDVVASEPARYTPELTFAASVSLRFEAPLSLAATPGGVRVHFTVQGTVEGPLLRGEFRPCSSQLTIDRDGIGTLDVRALLLIRDGAVAELEASGRCDLGVDGYRRAKAADLPNSALGWCSRFLTGHPHYLWLNRALHVAVGELRPREARIDYDLYVLKVRATSSGAGTGRGPSQRSTTA